MRRLNLDHFSTSTTALFSMAYFFPGGGAGAWTLDLAINSSKFLGTLRVRTTYFRNSSDSCSSVALMPPSETTTVLAGAGGIGPGPLGEGGASDETACAGGTVFVAALLSETGAFLWHPVAKLMANKSAPAIEKRGIPKIILNMRNH